MSDLYLKPLVGEETTRLDYGPGTPVTPRPGRENAHRLWKANDKFQSRRGPGRHRAVEPESQAVVSTPVRVAQHPRILADVPATLDETTFILRPEVPEAPPIHPLVSRHPGSALSADREISAVRARRDLVGMWRTALARALTAIPGRRNR
jgi:hypothetical protein